MNVKHIVYIYGMRLRGFSPGCHPMLGFVERRDDPRDEYHDLLLYDRKLSEKEMRDYELEYIQAEIR